MLRLLILLLTVWLIVVLVKNRLERRRALGHKASSSPRLGKMVRCAQCALHVPETEAIQYRGRFYCSPQHRDQEKSG